MYFCLQAIIAQSSDALVSNVKKSVISTQLFESVEPISTPTAKKQPIPAQWLPIGGLKAPVTLDGSLAGDVGFDPLGFSKSTKTLFWMREAEVKHGRLAMLAAVGW